MTKLQTKILVIIFFMVEIISAIGAYATNYYTTSRMGMLRHVVYLNNKWENLFNIWFIKVIFIAILLFLLIYILLQCKHITTHWQKILIAINSLINVFAIQYFIFSNTKINKAHYIIGICFFILALMQNIISILLIKIKSKKMYPIE